MSTNAAPATIATELPRAFHGPRRAKLDPGLLVGLTGELIARRKIQEGPFRWDMIEIQITRTSSTNYYSRRPVAQ